MKRRIALCLLALYPQERIIVNHLRESAGATRYERYQWQGHVLVLLTTA